jgi:carbonic anhydrase
MENKNSGTGNLMLLLVMLIGVFLVGFLIFGKTATAPFGPRFSAKPSPDRVLQMLKDGNERFSAGQSAYLTCDPSRIGLADKSDQGDYAYATVLSCSDSRVPVELIFDAGIMDLFVVRVAGNVCDTDEIGSIEYGLAHVKTPVLVVLGHTRCGAVTAVAQAVSGHGHKLERNIPPLVDNIVPAVQRAIEQHQDLHSDAIVPFAIEENVWQSVEDLFMRSPAVRDLAKSGRVLVTGAIYDLGSGKMNWLPQAKIEDILKRVEASADKETEAYVELK